MQALRKAAGRNEEQEARVQQQHVKQRTGSADSGRRKRQQAGKMNACMTVQVVYCLHLSKSVKDTTLVYTGAGTLEETELITNEAK